MTGELFEIVIKGTLSEPVLELIDGSIEDGITLLDGDRVHHFPAEAPEVHDVSGAGDTAVAVLAAGMAAGLSLPRAARIANIAGGLVVGQVGTAVARESDLLEALKA